jgi:hypothetical protein
MRPWNEDMAWQRVQDVQREAENRRLIASGGAPDGRANQRITSPPSLMSRAATAVEYVIWILNLAAHVPWWSS